MYGIPVVKSKLIMPQLPHFFTMSGRLEKLIKLMVDRNVVIITTPAGYGKTTLMVAALNAFDLNCRICWYRLEQEDKDLAVFYTHLVETLFPREGEWDECRSSLANFGDIRSQYHAVNAVICHELWSFYSHENSIKTFIVLDDFQQVLHSPEICTSIQYLIHNLPGNFTVMISSRFENDILTGKMRLEKKVLEVGMDDLCFSAEELVQILDKGWGSSADEKVVQRIMATTEGWAAGIILLCHFLSKDHDREPHKLLEGPLEKELLFKYIASEVIKKIDRELMLFLVKAAILRDFTATKATAIFQLENPAQLLGQCEQNGLFIQKIIGKVITYRFHGLFREFLIQIQPEYLSEKEITQYHLQAAAYYIEEKTFDRAMDHFIACNNTTKAVELLTRESGDLFPFEALEQLRLWFKILPEDIVNKSAVLLYIKSYIYMRGEEDALVLLQKALPKFKENNDLIMQIKTLFTIVHFYAFRNDVRMINVNLSQLEALLKTCDDNKDFLVIETITALLKAFWQEKFSRGIDLSRKANRFALDDEWKWLAIVTSCQLHYLLGELNTAEIIIKEAFAMDLLKKAEMIKGFALLFYAVVLHLRHDQAAFSSLKEEMLAVGEKYNFLYILGYGKRLLALESYCEHDPQTAMQLLQSSTYHFQQLGNEAMCALNKLSECLLLSGQQRKAAELLAEANESFKILAAAKPGFCLLEIGQSMLGALARDAADYASAEKNLLASIRRSKSKNAKQILCGSYMHLAKLYYDNGKKKKGEKILRNAFQLASSNRYYMFWDLHLPTLIEMSARCIQSGIYSEYALDLMASYYGKEAAEFFKNAAEMEESHLEDFCRTFISRFGIAGGDTALRVNICLFGRFSITINGVVLPENSFKTRKMEGILKYLLLHRGRTVTREHLMELFWPGSDKKSASMSLRAALYELRKLLKRYGMPAKGKAALLEEKTAGLEIKAGDMLFVDADEFLSLYHEFKGLPDKETVSPQKTKLLERMVQVYKGNLLEEELNEDWAYFEREELRSIFLEAVLLLASIYDERKELKKSEKLLFRTLALDPYNEEVCLALLQVYISTNQRSRARQLYLSFEKLLEQDLAVKPDARFSSLLKGIISS